MELTQVSVLVRAKVEQPSHSRVLDLHEGGPVAAAAAENPGPGRTESGQDRSGGDRPPLGSSSPVQGDIEVVHQIGRAQAGVLNPDQVADSPPPLPTVRRGSRIKHQTDFYQAGVE